MPTEFYFEIQYFNCDWNITTTLLHSHRNTQLWQVRDAAATVVVKRRHIRLCKIWKSGDAKKLFYVHINNVALNFTEFYWILKYKNLKIHEFYWILNVQILDSQSMAKTWR